MTTPERLNTRLEAEGAEFLVLGHLLIEKIAAYKNYTNGKGYDLVAINPETQRCARIQVKSRWATNASAFLLRRAEECDFVVFVKLNRGHRRRKLTGTEGKAEPTFHVVPASVAKQATRQTGWGKLKWSSIENPSQYQSAWDLIEKFLAGSRGRYPWEGRVELGQTIVAVEVPVFPIVKLTFADGYKATLDLSRHIKGGPAVAPLRDPALFKTAHPGSNGGSLEWIGPNGEEFDFCADSLRMEAEGIWDSEKRVWKW